MLKTLSNLFDEALGILNEPSECFRCLLASDTLQVFLHLLAQGTYPQLALVVLRKAFEIDFTICSHE